jgi:putative molybdopterin biosynthesis protein
MSKIELLDQFKQIKQLADPRRLEIVRLLLANSASLTQLGSRLDQHPARVRHHLQKLMEAGLVELDEITITNGITEKFYRAKAGAYLFHKLVLPIDTERETIICSGSHDLAVDILSHNLGKGVNVLSLPNGSLDGLIALRQGFCHITGSHLMDADGDYNTTYVRNLLADHDPIIITLANRQQGLMMAAGNPKRIQGVEDLAREDIHFINRQSGSGTRQWLDARLRREGISSTSINGYDDTVKTHTEIAMKVASGEADAGVGLQASANRLNLDFIPLFTERFDLVTAHNNLAITTPILDFMQSSDFRNNLSKFPGYDSTHTGEQIHL